MIRVLQGNLHRSTTAQNLLLQLVREKSIDIAIISEQHHNQNNQKWYVDDLGTAAIWAVTNGHIEDHGSGAGYVWLQRGGITYFSCYFTPNESIREFERKLGQLEDAIQTTTGCIVVAGDFNAKALEWGMPDPDTRGRLILEMAARKGLVLLNEGDTPTFHRPGQRGTIPDISWASENTARRVQNWKVIDEFTGSDHQYITFDLQRSNQRGRSQSGEGCQVKGWNLSKLDRDKMAQAILEGNTLLSSREHVQQLGLRSLAMGISNAANTLCAKTIVEETMKIITKACNVAMPKKVLKPGKPPVYWWNEDIARLRRVCNQLRRRAQRSRRTENWNHVHAEFTEARKKLRHEINKSKVDCWKRIIDEIDVDTWGRAYKIVTGKLKAPGGTNLVNEETMESIVNELFPTHPSRNTNYGNTDAADVPLFTEDELKKAIGALKNKKAPGPDGVPSEVLKIITEVCPELLLRMYNASLRAGIFGKPWKTSRLVLLDKGKGDPNLPSSWRPLCMLDTAGKGFEKLLLLRLLPAIEQAGDLSAKQYGFRKGRSTVHALTDVVSALKKTQEGSRYKRNLGLLVTLDVKNAFNSARWSDMLESLSATFKVPSYLLAVMDDYLRNRTLKYETAQGVKTKEITAGAAQGSVLGPQLWNAAYDGVLRLEMPEDCFLVGYADDVAAVILARTMDMAQVKLGQIMTRVSGWMQEHSLTLAAAKTEVVVFTRKRIPTIVPIQIGNTEIITKPAARYLGVMLDTKITFGEHIRKIADRAAQKTTALSHLMRNMNGPKPCKRRLMMTVVQSILLYGAEVWADALNVAYLRKRLVAVQRRGALRIACAYRTVSEPAILVLTGVIPIHLMASERKRIFDRREEDNRSRIAKEEREHTMDSWQELWTAEHRGRWTARLVPNIQTWMDRKHGEVDFYLTQFLTGHGIFYAYLFKMGKVPAPTCLHCHDGEDDVQHTFLDCNRWVSERSVLVESLELTPQQTTPEGVVSKMLEGEKNWSLVAKCVEGILKKKILFERRRERGGLVLPPVQN